MAVRFYEQEVKSKLKDRRRLSTYLQSLIRRQKPQVKDVQLTYIFCKDGYLLEINREYLKHETLTDIITFDLTEEPEIMQGEVYISIERVKENAEKYKVEYEQELHRVIFHGALHLCGFKDKQKGDKERMHQEEDLCLNHYFNG
jgi:rRNA maturation RNase YbeY